VCLKTFASYFEESQGLNGNYGPAGSFTILPPTALAQGESSYSDSRKPYVLSG